MTMRIKNVSKSFNKKLALDNVSLEFGDNKIYGLLGNNGAGKTTLFNIITSRLFADNGEITLDNNNLCDDDKILSQMYMLSEKNYYPESMTVNEALGWAEKLYKNFDMAVANDIANRFQLPLKSKITDLSTGYGTIFKIAVALSVNTPLLLLDEPVLGLDAGHRDMFYKLLIERYTKNPCTIVISTHLIAEAANLIEHCFIIKDGRIIEDSPCEALVSKGYSISGPKSLVDEFIKQKDVIYENNLGGLKTASIKGEVPDEAPEGLEISRLNLQEYFINLVGNNTTSGRG